MEQKDFIITEDIQETMTARHSAVCPHLVVMSGKVSFELEGNVFHAKTDDCIIKPSASAAVNIHHSADFSMRGVILSYEYLRKALPQADYSTRGLLSMLHNPVMPMLHADALKILADIEQIGLRLQQSYHLYYEEMMKRAIEMMVLDLYDVHSRMMSDDSRNISQSAKILRLFINYLQTGMYR